jgi:hypothetical protein
MIIKATKKPVTIEAVELTIDDQIPVAFWCHGKLIHHSEKPVIQIFTLEGTICATVGDYIIKGVKGEFQAS